MKVFLLIAILKNHAQDEWCIAVWSSAIPGQHLDYHRIFSKICNTMHVSSVEGRLSLREVKYFD